MPVLQSATVQRPKAGPQPLRPVRYDAARAQNSTPLPRQGVPLPGAVACICGGGCPACARAAPRVLVGRRGGRLEEEAHGSVQRVTPVQHAPEAFDEATSPALLQAVLALSASTPPEGLLASRLTAALGAEAATVAGRSYFAPNARKRHGLDILQHEAVHARQQGKGVAGVVHVQAYDPPTGGTQPFRVVDIGGRPMLDIPVGLPPGPAAEAALARLESMAASGAGVRELSRAALTETAALPGGAAVRAQFYQRASSVIQGVAGRSWQAVPMAGPGGSVVFLGSAQRATGSGYGAIIASDGTVATGAYAAEEVSIVAGEVRLNMAAWRVISAPAAATASTGAATAAAGTGLAVRPPSAGGAGSALSSARTAGMARAVAINVLLFIAVYLLQRWLEARQQERLEQLWDANVTPALTQRLTELTTSAWAAMLADPFPDRYARIEADVAYSGHPDLPGRPSAWEVQGASFVQATMVTQREATSVRTVRESVSGPLTRTPLVRTDFGPDATPLVASTPLDTFQRSDRVTIWEPLVPQVPPERIRLAVEAAVAGNRTLGSMLAGHRDWSSANMDALATAYRAAAAGQPALLAEADARAAEIRTQIDAERRYGAGTYSAARSSFEAGLSARQSAGQTHWRDAAQRLNFVRAYVAVSTGAEHVAALAYARELEAQMPPDDDAAFRDLARSLDSAH